MLKNNQKCKKTNKQVLQSERSTIWANPPDVTTFGPSGTDPEHVAKGA